MKLAGATPSRDVDILGELRSAEEAAGVALCHHQPLGAPLRKLMIRSCTFLHSPPLHRVLSANDRVPKAARVSLLAAFPAASHGAYYFCKMCAWNITSLRVFSRFKQGDPIFNHFQAVPFQEDLRMFEACIFKSCMLQALLRRDAELCEALEIDTSRNFLHDLPKCSTRERQNPTS